MIRKMGVSTVVRLVFGLMAPPSKSDSASFDALAAWMRAHADLELEEKTWPTYRALAESVREGKSDIAWLPPVVYAWLAEGVTPLGSIVRGGSTTYSAALVTLEGSKLHALADLRGARAAWVDPWSAAGYVVPRIELAKAGIAPSTFASEKFYGSHRDALLALSRGERDFAGTYARTRDDATAPEGAWSEIEDLHVRVLATFSSIPSDVIAVRRNLAPAEYERALEAFRRASADEAARPLLRAVFGGDTLREGVEPGHDALRSAFESATASGLFD